MTFDDRTSYGISEMVVTVTGVDLVANHAMVTDGRGNEFEVSIGLRPKGTGLPAVGERWLVVKKSGLWALSMPLTQQPTAVITGDRESDSQVILAQILEALAIHGIVIDLTTGLPLSVEPDDDNDPGIEPYSVDDADNMENEEGEESIPGLIPEESVDDDENISPPKDPKNRWGHVSVATFNTAFTLGPSRAASDLRRLTKTKADVILLQEAWQPYRTALIASIAGFSAFRPAGRASEVTIMWRTETMKFIASGTHMLQASEGPGTHLMARYVNWVRLEHRDTGVIATYMSTHIEAGAANAGFFQPEDIKVVRFRAEMDAFMSVLPPHLIQGAVFLGGDFNVDWRDDYRLRNPSLPYVRFRSLGMKSNFEVLGVTQPGVGSHHGSNGDHGSLFDQIYLSDGDKDTIKPVSQKILFGYYSDHRPVLVTYKMRKKKP